LAILPIYKYPHTILRQRAKKIRTIDKSIQKLVDDMMDTLQNSGGVGLAANQIGILKRLIVIQLPEDEEPTAYINPEIIHREGKREVQEGCLSIPGYYGTITRSMWIKAKGMDRKSRIMKITAEGLLSQIIEHEIDHINGILYIDHLNSHEDLIKESSEIPASTA
tara:strand:- start:7414 stop:7908 length:495 start_codon:yes stop_codon:yes gene_type:complete